MKKIFSVLLIVSFLLLCLCSSNFKSKELDISALSTGDKFKLGTYPQSQVTDEKTIQSLSASPKDELWISYNYYAGTSPYYGSGAGEGPMKASGFMKYADIELNGKKYRAVKFDGYRPAFTGSKINTGEVPDNSAQFNNGYLKDNVFGLNLNLLNGHL